MLLPVGVMLSYSAFPYYVRTIGVNNGLATRVTLIRVSRERLGESVMVGGFIFVLWLCLGCVLNGTACVNTT